MTDKLSVPFLEATRKVFELMLDLYDVSLSFTEIYEENDEVNISIGVTGDLVGEVIYRFPHKTSLNMVTIMSGMEFDNVDDFVTSAISEIANIISGNVMTMLEGKNLHCDIMPPVLQKASSNQKYEINTTCCLTTSAGQVFLEARLNQAKEASAEKPE